MRNQSATWEAWGKSQGGDLIPLGGSNRTTSLSAKASVFTAQDISSSEEERPADLRYPPGLVPSKGAKAAFKNPLRNNKTYKSVSQSKRRVHEQETCRKAQSTIPQKVFVSNSSSSLSGAPVPLKSAGRKASQPSTSSGIDAVSAERCSPESSSHGPRRFPLGDDEADELNIRPSKRKAEPFPMDIGSSLDHNLPNAPKPFPMGLEEDFSAIFDVSQREGDVPDVLRSPWVFSEVELHNSPPSPLLLPSSSSAKTLSDLSTSAIMPKSQATSHVAKPFPLSTPETDVCAFPLMRNNDVSVRASPPKKSRIDYESLPTSELEADVSYQAEASIDPSTLCPFCDEPWPSDPSLALTSLLKRVRRKAWPNKRYTNPEGLKAPLEAIIDLCNMHRSEASIIPEGIAKGWPSEIDFDAIPSRLWKLRPKLQKLIDHPSGWHFFEIAKQDVKVLGSVVTNSTRGQFASFSRTRPGYYGERGFVRIANALRDLFPGLTNQRSLEPLDVDSFFLRVLIPETARLLIMEDLGLNEVTALSVLQESQKYGAAKFPDCGEEDGPEKFGISMRVRLKLGQERFLADKEEAEGELSRERRKTKKGEAARYPLPPSPSSSARIDRLTKNHAGARPPLTDIPSSTESTSSGHQNAVHSNVQRTPKSKKKRKKKRTLLGDPSSMNAFTSYLSSQPKGTYPLSNSSTGICTSSSITSIASSVPSSTGWTRTLREDILLDDTDGVANPSDSDTVSQEL